MYKAILMILSFWIITTTCQAQSKKFSVGISASAGIPVGSWGKLTTTNFEKFRTLNTGLAYDISLSYSIGESHFGLTSLVRFQTNMVDTDTYAEFYTNENPEASYKVESYEWKMNQFLMGAFWKKPISNNLDFELRALSGIVLAGRPLTTVFANETSYISQNSSSAIAFAYLFGTGIKYHLNKKLDLLVNIDYLNAQPKFEIDETSNIGSFGKIFFHEAMSSVNIGAGLAVKF